MSATRYVALRAVDHHGAVMGGEVVATNDERRESRATLDLFAEHPGCRVERILCATRGEAIEALFEDDPARMAIDTCWLLVGIFAAIVSAVGVLFILGAL